MRTGVQDLRWHLLGDARQVAEDAARRVLEVASSAIGARGAFRVVLAGGGTPERAYRLLGEAPADWGHWHIYFGDERCLPEDHPERNSVMAARAWLGRVPIPSEQVHPIPAELGPKLAAQRYGPVVADALPFDLVLLGLGEDGHTASLFPGHTHAAGALVVPVSDAPRPPPARVSLGEDALANAETVLVLVTGSGKREAVSGWRAGADLPVARIRPARGVDVLLDAAASGTG